MNVLCLGGRTMGVAVAWDCARSFLNAQFSGAERHRRRLAKVLKSKKTRPELPIAISGLVRTEQE